MRGSSPAIGRGVRSILLPTHITMRPTAIRIFGQIRGHDALWNEPSSGRSRLIRNCSKICWIHMERLAWE
jgi:hypothetical protein